MELRGALWNLLGFVVLPLWLMAGAADWLCHRRANIERTSGVQESRLHIVLYLLVALPALAAMYLQINAGLLALMAAAVGAHTLVSLRDTATAQPRRHVSPFEQLVHSHLDMLPVGAFAIVLVLHIPELADPSWMFAVRVHSPPLAWRVALGALLAMGLLPILEELFRCLRYRASALHA